MTKEKLSIFLDSSLVIRLDKHRAETKQKRSELINAWLLERIQAEEQAKEGTY